MTHKETLKDIIKLIIVEEGLMVESKSGSMRDALKVPEGKTIEEKYNGDADKASEDLIKAVGLDEAKAMIKFTSEVSDEASMDFFDDMRDALEISDEDEDVKEEGLNHVWNIDLGIDLDDADIISAVDSYLTKNGFYYNTETFDEYNVIDYHIDGGSDSGDAKEAADALESMGAMDVNLWSNEDNDYLDEQSLNVKEESKKDELQNFIDVATDHDIWRVETTYNDVPVAFKENDNDTSRANLQTILDKDEDVEGLYGIAFTDATRPLSEEELDFDWDSLEDSEPTSENQEFFEVSISYMIEVYEVDGNELSYEYTDNIDEDRKYSFMPQLSKEVDKITTYELGNTVLKNNIISVKTTSADNESMGGAGKYKLVITLEVINGRSDETAKVFKQAWFKDNGVEDGLYAMLEDKYKESRDEFDIVPRIWAYTTRDGYTEDKSEYPYDIYADLYIEESAEIEEYNHKYQIGDKFVNEYSNNDNWVIKDYYYDMYELNSSRGAKTVGESELDDMERIVEEAKVETAIDPEVIYAAENLWFTNDEDVEKSLEVAEMFSITPRLAETQGFNPIVFADELRYNQLVDIINSANFDEYGYVGLNEVIEDDIDIENFEGNEYLGDEFVGGDDFKYEIVNALNGQGNDFTTQLIGDDIDDGVEVSYEPTFGGDMLNEILMAALGQMDITPDEMSVSDESKV